MALNELNALQTRFETREKESQLREQASTIENQELTLERNTAIISGLLIGLGLLLVLWLWWRNRVQKQQQAALNQLAAEAREAQLTAMIDSQEQERHRFATDLHDGLGQLISVLHMQVRTLLGNSSTADKSVLEHSNTLLSDMYTELKAICFNMMPHALNIGGLQPAIEELAVRVNSGTQITMELAFFMQSARHHERLEVAVFRMVQEWTNNVLKYSGATNIALDITSDATELTVMITDNGKGFDTAVLTNSKGNGWKNMQQRANLIKAELTVESQPGHNGSTFILNVPLASESD